MNFRYCFQQISLACLIHWTPAVRICIWWLLLPYNWCDTDIKRQSPAPPTSIDCKRSSPNLDCIKFSEDIGEVNCIVELWFCIKGLIITSWWPVLYWSVGPGFFSTSLLNLKSRYYLTWFRANPILYYDKFYNLQFLQFSWLAPASSFRFYTTLA